MQCLYSQFANAKKQSARIAQTVLATGIVLGIGAIGSTAAQAQTTVNEGELTVASDMTYPPYVYFDNKKPAGFDADFSYLMGDKLELETKIIDTRFSDLVLGLRANRYDMIASALYVTPERAKLIDYVPYLKTGTSILALSSSDASPKTPEDLCGMKVSNIKGSSWRPKVLKVSQEICEKEGKGAIDMQEFPTSPEALMALKSGAVDVMMEDAAVAHGMVDKEKDKIKITSDEMIYPIVIALGVNKKNTELKDALYDALDKAKESGEYQELLDKYGLSAPSEEDFEDSLNAEES